MTFRVEIAVKAYGAVAWRNNSGALPDRRGVPVRFGLGNISKALNDVWKSSDYIGMCADGRFLALEQKPQGWRFSMRDPHERAQLAFIHDVRRRGGVAGFVTCDRDVYTIMAISGAGRATIT